MNILLLENTKYNLENLPEEVDDLRFAIMDNSNPNSVDYHYIPLIFLETFNSPALVLRVDDCTIKMPLDWQILIGEPDFGDLEIVPLTSINDRGFKAYEFNPLSSFRPTFVDIEIVDVYHDVTWYAPRLRNGQFLCVPIEEGRKPRCIYFVKEVSKNCEVVDFSQAF
jgi:hypothetical protein